MLKALADSFIKLKYLNSIPPELFLLLLAVYAYDIFRSPRFALYVLPLHISINLYLRITESITLNMVEMLAWLMFGAWAVKTLWRKLRLGEPWRISRSFATPLAIVLMIYLLTYLLLLANTPFGEETIKSLARAVEIGMVFFALRTTIKTRRDIQVMTASLLASSVFVGLLAWYQRLFITDSIAYYRHVGTLVDLGLLPRIPWWYDSFVELSPVIRVGANIDPGGLSTGIYLPPVILLALLAAWWAKGKTLFQLWRKRLPLLGLAALLTGALLFTLARSGIYALAGALALVLLLASPKYGKYALVLGIVVVLIASQFTRSYSISRILSQSVDAARSSQGRLVRAQQSWEIIKGAPLIGAGIGSFGEKPGQVFPHNQYLAAFQARGVVAFFSLLALFGLAAWEAWRCYRLVSDRFLKGVLIWSLGVMASYFLHGLAHTPLDEIQIGAIFWMALALAEALAHISDTETAAGAARVICA